MVITPMTSGGYSAYQQLTNAGRKVGVICEAPTLSEAIDGAVMLVSKHCNMNNIHPERVLKGVAHK